MFDADVRCVLRGQTKLGKAHFTAVVGPAETPQYLFMGSLEDVQSAHRVDGSFGVMPLRASFRSAQLHGKPSRTQLLIVFQARLRDLRAGKALPFVDQQSMGGFPGEIRHIEGWLRRNARTAR